MGDISFPDLEGSFELAEDSKATLGDAGQIQQNIAEQQLRKTYWRIRFRRVQYGTFQGAPVCLLVVDGVFHPEDRKRHRFTWARIAIEFSSDGEPVEVVKLVPECAYGITVPEERTSSWALSSSISITVPGTPVSVDLLRFEGGRGKKYNIDRVARMQGTERGFPHAKEAVWTLEEANQEGIPWRVPSLVVLAKHQRGSTFKAQFKIEARVGFSINPSRWPMFNAAPTPVLFDGKAELVQPGEELDPNFTTLDLSTLTKLDFTEDR